MNIRKDSSEMDGYILQEIKSVVLKIDSIKNYLKGETWKIGDKDIPVVEQPTHMGIPHSSTDPEMHVVETNMQKARRTMYILIGNVVHGKPGLDPETAISLLQTYVFSVLNYRMEAIIPTYKALNRLEIQQKKYENKFCPCQRTWQILSIYNLGYSSRGSCDTQENEFSRCSEI